MSVSDLVPDNNQQQIIDVFAAINSYRASLGLSAVKYNVTVSGMTQQWSDTIAAQETFNHNPNFLTDSRAAGWNAAGEVIAVRWDRNAAGLVDWWKNSPAHNAILTNPKMNVVGIGITFTDGNPSTTPNRYAMYGVVNFYGYSSLPATTFATPSAAFAGTSGSGNNPGYSPGDPACQPPAKQMPPTANLRTASIRSGADVVTVDAGGTLRDQAATGSGGLGAARVIGAGYTGVQQIFTTDWNRDGVFDLLIQYSDGRLAVQYGLLTGGFQPAVVLGQSGWDSMQLAVGQWCMMNRLPQIAALDPAGNLWFYPNRQDQDLNTRQLLASGLAGATITMVDFDGDGFQDILARSATGTLTLYRSKGNLALVAESRRAVGSGWQGTVASVSGFTGPSSRGLMLATPDGTVSYYPIGAGAFGAPSRLPGNWSGLGLAR